MHGIHTIDVLNAEAEERSKSQRSEAEAREAAKANHPSNPRFQQQALEVNA